MINKALYNIICFSRNKKTLDFINKLAKIDDYNEIIPNLYLGNINCSYNNHFLLNNNIKAIVNCTENEPFHEYFSDNSKFRLNITDSKDKDNIIEFKNKIFEAIHFIDESLNNNKPVYVHCYWGLMRSATVVAAYLIKKYNMPKEIAITMIREKRPYALLSFYNFNEVLEHVEKNIN